jgi:hypothetical protein
VRRLVPAPDSYRHGDKSPILEKAGGCSGSERVAHYAGVALVQNRIDGDGRLPSASPTGTEMIRAVRRTTSPSLIGLESPRSTTPTRFSSRFQASRQRTPAAV